MVSTPANVDENPGPKEKTVVPLEFDTILKMSQNLAYEIDQHCRDTGERYDGMVILPRGGLYVAMVLSRMFKMEAPELINAGLTSYSHGQTNSNGTFREGQLPTRQEVEGKRLLVPDDVFDTGQTEQRVTRHLLEQGAAKVTTATLFAKPDNSVVDMVPDFCMEEVGGNVWLQFPWEPFEDLIENPSVWSGNEYSQLGSLASGAVLLSSKDAIG